MRLLIPPGVFRPPSDTWMLVETVRTATLPPRAAALDLCTGSGVLAIAAARRGVRDVTSVDISRRAVLAARLNARLNGVRVRVVRGDLYAPLRRARFDLIVSNPPYVPAETNGLPRSGAERHWEAGVDGRALLDRIIAGAPEHLRRGGTVLVVQSSIIDIERTLELMRAAGLEPDVPIRRTSPLGPLMSARVHMLEGRGMLRPGQRDEEVAVVRGRLTG